MSKLITRTLSATATRASQRRGSGPGGAAWSVGGVDTGTSGACKGESLSNDSNSQNMGARQCRIMVPNRLLSVMCPGSARSARGIDATLICRSPPLGGYG